MDESQIAKNIKSTRLNKKMSQGALADLCGFTKGYISRIEKSDKPPPFTTLDKIAKALNVDLTLLLSEETELPRDTQLCIVRKDEAKKISATNLHGYHYIALAHKKSGKNMEPFIIMPAFDEEAIFSHEGEEFMYVLEGTHELIYNDKGYILREGDSVYFDSIIPHTGRSIGEKRAKVLTVLYSYKRNHTSGLIETRINPAKQSSL
jgi:transcriptional regulator with XRE-family HTH domain